MFPTEIQIKLDPNLNTVSSKYTKYTNFPKKFKSLKIKKSMLVKYNNKCKRIKGDITKQVNATNSKTNSVFYYK